jgi:hypothetical protein
MKCQELVGLLNIAELFLIENIVQKKEGIYQEARKADVYLLEKKLYYKN